MGAFYIVIASVLANAFADHVNENIEHILPSSEAKEWRIQDYMGYLQQIVRNENHKLGNFRLSFPRALVYDRFTLRNGRVTKYLTPTIPFGFYDRVMFHAKKNELFGVFQLYAPVMEIVYDFPGGQLVMTVTHSPVQIHMGVGTVNGGACRIERGHHDAFYFFDDQLKVDAQFLPNGPHSEQQIVNEISNTWLPLLYKIIFDIRMQMFVSREKEKLLQNHRQYPLVSNVCTSIS
uniref:Lipid-binding serum glycoprotein N-terminal domain-containing protein n=2 Tax=Homalodisca liturata TaxID=320908 RepID=A0A1B6IV38_9HEMI